MAFSSFKWTCAFAMKQSCLSTWVTASLPDVHLPCRRKEQRLHSLQNVALVKLGFDIFMWILLLHVHMANKALYCIACRWMYFYLVTSAHFISLYCRSRFCGNYESAVWLFNIFYMYFICITMTAVMWWSASILEWKASLR